LKKGVALIVTLWVLLILSTMATSFAYRMRLGIRATAYQRDSFKALALAQAGVERAIAELKNELETDTSSEQSWQKGHQMTLAGGKVAYNIVDEESKVCINSLLEDEKKGSNALEMLKKLPGVDSELGASIMDWIDEPSATHREGGAESDYYLSLPGPYPCKDGPLDTVEELLLVKGMTPYIFYGEDLNDNGTLQKAEDENGDGELRVGIKDLVTVYTGGRININTATAVALQAGFGLGTDLIDYIVSYRESHGPLRNSEEVQTLFAEMADSLRVSSHTKKRLEELLKRNRVTVKSSVFRINSVGILEDGLVAKRVRTIVQINPHSVKTIYWREE